jgi:hypothetical protein
MTILVMDFIDGETVEKADTLPPTFGQQIRDILSVLHQTDYVFGPGPGPVWRPSWAKCHDYKEQ